MLEEEDNERERAWKKNLSVTLLREYLTVKKRKKKVPYPWCNKEALSLFVLYERK